MPSLPAMAARWVDQRAGIDAAQVETLAARQHRHRHLADFGRGEDELGVRRRLFQRLEQRVERRSRQHVHLVEDVDLVARAHRRVADRIIDLANVVDAVMGGGIHLDHVEMPALHDGRAVHAELRHRDRRPGDRAVRQFVVERTCQDAGRGGLADAADAGEDPGLRDARSLERIRDRAHHGVLADQIVESLRPVLAGQHPVAAARGLLPERKAGSRGIGTVSVAHSGLAPPRVWPI